MLTNNLQKTCKVYHCEKCDYTCSRKSSYNIHIQSKKHNANNANNNANKKLAEQIYTCACGKIYKHRSSFSRHSAICNYSNDYNMIDKPDNISKNQERNAVNDSDIDYKSMVMELIKNANNNNNTDTIMELIKQNQEFKELIVDQNKTIMELSARTNNITNNNNNTINNNNQKFNLNFFLNNTCKDAMNMSEFIENLDVNFNDIEYIGRNGYVNGMTNMILSRIKDLDVTKRPLHCTDLKRETMYIKDNDEWNKDTPDNTRLRNMVKIVAKQNQYQIPLWREKHPASDDMNSATFEFSLKMIQNILGDVGEEQIKLDNKVMRNLSKHILVDKNV